MQYKNVPQIWRDAVIVPLLKANKPASDLASFRPISLTSCVVKVMERMVSERLYDMAERNGWFSKLQAGFRKGRGVEDQILRITQKIDDGFQKKPAERSVLTLLDFSKVYDYDTVWRERLLLTLLDNGVPNWYVLWLSNFLSNRQAKVRYNGAFSGYRKMSQGLPQGSVLAPILFLFYIDELAKLLPDNITTSIYADDVSFLASAPQLVNAEKISQDAVDVVVEWSRRWKLNLNGSKSEVTFFSKSPHEAKWSPSILINNAPIRYEPHARFLGVTLDRQLSFNKQVELVTTKATGRMRMLSALAHSDWGWRKQDLRRIYLAHVRSILNFASSSWQPWLSNTQVNKLEVVQNKYLRIITGQTRSSPLEALRAESNIPSIKSEIAANGLRSREKALRLPKDHPRFLAATDESVQRLKRWGWKKNTVEYMTRYMTELVNQERKPLTFFDTRPWEKGIGSTRVFPHLPGICGRNDDSDLTLRVALDHARELNGRFTIYTDGSAGEGTMNGGAGAVITTGDPSAPTVVHVIKEKGARFTCSYEEEVRALEIALDWATEECSETDSIAVFTDSQSLCEGLLGTSPRLDTLRFRLRNISFELTIQWIPGHKNIPGNNLADETAKLAAASPGPHKPIPYGSACSQIRMTTKDPPVQHARTRAIYGEFSMRREAQIKSRSDQTLLARLRSGHHISLMAYRHRLDAAADPLCPLCNEEEHDVMHWVQKCPATERTRRELFGEDSGRLECLTKYPAATVILARKTLLKSRQ